MIVASLILILSTALFFFYLQMVCQRLLRREFVEPFYLRLAQVTGLEFPALREEVGKAGCVGDLASIADALRCDFTAVAYLLKKASRTRHLTPGDRLLLLYWRVMFMSLRLRHILRLQEKPAFLELTAILQYFANVVGARVAPVPSNGLVFGE
jgi:hypothetical protein